MSPHCDHCPVAGELAICPAIARPHPPYCNLVNPQHVDHRPAYRDELVIQAGLASRLAERPRIAPGAPIEPVDRIVAPSRTTGQERPWEGSLVKKPWEYRVTAVLCHLDAPELLRAALAGLRAQTLRPYLMVIDTGSLAVHRRQLEELELEHEDLEIHYLRSKGYQHSSEPITAANDLAFSLCQTELLFSTHVDVFLKQRTFVEWLASLCDERTPAAGYRMSSRDWKTDLWQHCLGHSATVYHMPTWRRLGLTWSLARARELLGLELEQSQWGWPDTETAPGLGYRAAGYRIRTLDEPADGRSILAVGDEINDIQEDDRLIHVRSTTSHRLYQPATAAARAERLQREVMAAWQRIHEWNQLGQRLRANAHLAPYELVKGCDYRGPKAECGCNELRICLLGKGDDQHRVSMRDCVECVTASDRAASPSTGQEWAPAAGPAVDPRPAPAGTPAADGPGR